MKGPKCRRRKYPNLRGRQRQLGSKLALPFAGSEAQAINRSPRPVASGSLRHAVVHAVAEQHVRQAQARRARWTPRLRIVEPDERHSAHHEGRRSPR
jgi:hypothetical protein